MLAAKSQCSPEVIDRGLAYLDEHPEQPEHTGPVLLATRLVQRLSTDSAVVPRAQARLEHVLRYLDDVHEGVQGDLRAEANVDIITLFLEHGVGDEAARRQQLLEWAAIQQQRDGLGKLPRLVAEGRFFLLVWHYYETLTSFGLTTAPAISYAATAWMTADRQSELLVEWHQADRVVPDVIVRGRFGSRLSGDFVRFGRMLFRSPVAEDPEFDEARAAFNASAADAMNRVYVLLLAVPDMPETLRDLLAEHRARLMRVPA
jgi:hypothetical protein